MFGFICLIILGVSLYYILDYYIKKKYKTHNYNESDIDTLPDELQKNHHYIYLKIL